MVEGGWWEREEGKNMEREKGEEEGEGRKGERKGGGER